MGCCCNEKKDGKKAPQTPDCMASKSTVVKTQDGEDVEVHFNMGTGEVTYTPKTDEADKKKSSGGCGCGK